MKIKSLLPAALLGAVTLLLAGQTSKAALVYNAGDLFIGFHLGSDSYLVDIGNVSLYSQQNGATFTVNTSASGNSIGPDLVSTFGPEWFNLGTVEWGVIGTTFSNLPDLNVVYASKQRSNPLVQSSPWKRESNDGQTEWAANVIALSNKYTLNGDSTGLSSSRATVQSGSSAGSNTYASFTLTNVDFGIGTIEGKFTTSGGTAGSVLDLYRLDPGYGQDGVYLGSFRINDSGVVTFTAVPEPGTLALTAIGGFFLLSRLRRRALANA